MSVAVVISWLAMYGALMSTESHVTRFWRLEVDFMYVCLVCGLNFSTQLLKLPRLGLLFESG